MSKKGSSGEGTSKSGVGSYPKISILMLLGQLEPPIDLVLLHEQFWGKPLDPSLTTIPTNEAMITESADLWEDNFDDQTKDHIFTEPFLVDMKPQLFVRAEYVRLFDKVEAIHRNYPGNSVVVTGQPGIGEIFLAYSRLGRSVNSSQGKSYWAYYALRRCLGRQQPVVWYQRRAFYLFGDDGVQNINPGRYQPVKEFTWCLVDSIYAKTFPISEFGHSACLFPIYIASPDEKRWKPLHQSRYPSRLVMNPWTWEEIKKTTIQERFNNAGPIPRICFMKDPDQMVQWYNERNSRIKNVDSLELLKKLTENSQTLPIGEPMTRVVARRLRARLWEARQKEITDLLVHFSRVPGGMAGLLFEAHFQQPTLQKALGSVLNIQGPSLSISPTEVIEYESSGPLEHKELVYYVPRLENQVAIDSFVVHDGNLYWFQFTVGSKHDINH
ncbi:6611_t:CDS:2, partial [Acaulospora colombiana]